MRRWVKGFKGSAEPRRWSRSVTRVVLGRLCLQIARRTHRDLRRKHDPSHASTVPGRKTWDRARDRLRFTGGEPFARSDIFELVEVVTRELDSELILLTNATLLEGRQASNGRSNYGAPPVYHAMGHGTVACGADDIAERCPPVRRSSSTLRMTHKKLLPGNCRGVRQS